MMTATTRSSLLIFCERLGVPLRNLLDHESWYERVVERLILAGGDPFDVITDDTTDEERRLILRAAVIIRHLTPPPSES